MIPSAENHTANAPLFDRDLSWLSFNYRVLLMAAEERVPLYERINFLSIFSSNLDEFFRVRMPAILAMSQVGPAKRLKDGDAPDTAILEKVRQKVRLQQETYGQILTKNILPGLREKGIHLYYGEPLHPEHAETVTDYFLTKVLSYLQVLWINFDKPGKVFLENNALYFAVSVTSDGADTPRYVIVNIPTGDLPRFLALPGQSPAYIAWLDDVIREHLPYIFPHHTINGCYSVKITRDAEMDLDELSSDMLAQVEKMILHREIGLPTRFLYDPSMPADMLELLAAYFEVLPEERVAGGRYHNLKDFNSLPMPVSGPGLKYPSFPPANVPGLDHAPILDKVLQQDVLLHLPYQRYHYILRFFNEAAIDPDVKEIYVTLYRVASGSQIVNALISAARNGKKVTVLVELKARFDEANNIHWAKRMKDAGVKIIYSIPGLKVHAKIALVKRKRGLTWDHVGLMATGNFNESTARFYTDHVLLTASQTMTQEMELLFLYLQTRQQPQAYGFIPFKELLVAQFNLVDRFRDMIDREIRHAQAGKPAAITIKLNNLQERAMIEKLYEAGRAGVLVELIVRGICCLVPGYAPNITLRRIVDRYLEHARIFVFHNDGAEEIYLGSADWMNRNLHRRIEVCFPIYGDALKQQVKTILALQLADNTNAVILDNEMNNMPVTPAPGEPEVNAQSGIYNYVKNLQTIQYA
ncbi:polyphosphate kinase 1 [Chitinophaga horti]|uniref:Polyphosphate kinase n=1 Tax=Chitinophaga horti TaxID=2920382 RepID=A0ABY6J5B4_9BACT|nr:polyphosphate kinase 1 [Chitinophaga horti]UYQ93369.1 polyphosphate kinase 1 [Chitinophaga horti]